MSMTRMQKELVHKVMDENELLRAQLNNLLVWYNTVRGDEDPTGGTILLHAEIKLDERRKIEALEGVETLVSHSQS